MKRLLALCLAVISGTLIICPNNIVFASKNNIIDNYNNTSNYSNNVIKSVTFTVSPNGELILLDENFSRNNISDMEHESKRIVIGSYILSQKQLQDIADNMMFLKNNNWLGLAEFLIGSLKIQGAGIVSFISNLARSSIFREDVVYAARQGKRVRIVITDYEKYHTSYSIVVKYEILD